jgi:hypothetical protein
VEYGHGLAARHRRVDDLAGVQVEIAAFLGDNDADSGGSTNISREDSECGVTTVDIAGECGGRGEGEWRRELQIAFGEYTDDLCEKLPGELPRELRLMI